MTRLFTLFCLFSVLVMTTTACTTVRMGKDFDPRSFEQWVARGETTQNEVKQRLGAPTSTGGVVESDGRYYVRWNYYYGQGKIYKLGDADFKLLEIRFNSEKKVVSYNWSAPEPKQETP